MACKNLEIHKPTFRGYEAKQRSKLPDDVTLGRLFRFLKSDRCAQVHQRSRLVRMVEIQAVTLVGVEV